MFMANEVKVEVTIDAKQAERALKAITNQTEKFENNARKNFNNATSAFNVFKGVISANVVTGAISAITRGITALGGSVINAAKDFEQIQTQFRVLTGSVEEADAVIRELQEFTATTPFQFESVAKAAQILTAFRGTTEGLLETLEVLGDVSAGTGKDLAELTTIFGQIEAAGKVTGERFNQLVEAGIPVGDVLAKQIGVSVKNLREEISKGNVSFEDFRAALNNLTAEGGVFFGATIQQSKTLGGLISTLSDNFAILAQGIGQAFLPFLKEAALNLTLFIQRNRELITALAVSAVENFVGALETLGTAFFNAIQAAQQVGEVITSVNQFITENQSLVLGAASAVGTFTVAVNANRIAQVASVATGKAVNTAIAAYTLVTQGATAATRLFRIALASIGVGLVIAGVAELVSRFETLEEFLLTVKAEFLSLGEVALGITQSFVNVGRSIVEFLISPINDLLLTVEKAASVFSTDLAQSIASVREEISNAGSFFDSVDEKITNLQTSLANRGAQALESAAQIREAAQIEKQAAIDVADTIIEQETRIQSAAPQRSGAGANAEESAAARQKELEAQKAFNNQKALLDEEFRLQQDEIELERRLANGEQTAEVRALQLENQLAQNQLILDQELAKNNSLKDLDKKRLADLRARNKFELANEKAKTKFQLQEQKTREQNFSSSLQVIQGLTASGNKTLFSIGKAAAISTATVDGFQAVQKALASAPPPINVALAAAVGAATAANIAKIASTQPPSFQFGGVVPGTPSNQDNTLANVASGEMILNRRQQAELFAVANGAAASSSPTVNVTVEAVTGTIPDETIDNLIDNINNRLEFGNAAFVG